jgi:NAD(P)H-hydrate epimerase
MPEGLYPVIASKVSCEIMFLPLPQTSQTSLSPKAFKEIKDFSEDADCVLLGPGLSTHPDTQRLARSCVAKLVTPMIVDADGLNALAGHTDVLKDVRTSLVLTPHPGEMARLCDRSGRDIGENRKKVAKDFALRYNVTLVLKGFQTVVASGDGEIYINATGNPGMATAGSGDCLAGILAALMGQGLPAYDAARIAVCVHGLAGDLAARDKTQISLIASDIIAYLPKAFQALQK